MLQEDLRAVNEDFFLISAKADIPVATTTAPTFTFPDGTGGLAQYEKIKSFWAATNPANVASPLPTEYLRCQPIDTNSITDPSYNFTNPTVVLFGSYFVLFPILTNTQIITGGMKLYYIPVQNDLSQDTDVPNIFPDYHDAITAGSLIDIARRMGKPDLKKDAEDYFARRRKEMKADAAQRVLDAQSSYTEGQTTEGYWAYPFGISGI